jgi:hypothetical protein
MNRLIARFGERLAGHDVGMFFFAGHGIQLRGKNYLIPVDAQIASENSVRAEAVDVDAVLDQLSASPLNVVILDACRNNPFERRFRSVSGGLAQMDAPRGTLIAYATAPGKVAQDGDGANSTYTTALLKALGEPGLPVESVFKRVRAEVARVTGDNQVPWEASSLTGDFYFAIARGAGAGVRRTEAAPAAADTEAELLFWQSVKDSQDIADFEAYLKQYPVRSLCRHRAEPAEAAFRRQVAGGCLQHRPLTANSAKPLRQQGLLQAALGKQIAAVANEAEFVPIDFVEHVGQALEFCRPSAWRDGETGPSPRRRSPCRDAGRRAARCASCH